MIDVVLIAGLLVFFGVCIAYVRVCDWIIGRESVSAHPTTPDAVVIGDIVALVISILVLAYLVYALLAPEKL